MVSAGKALARCRFGAKCGACVRSSGRYSSQRSRPTGEPRSGGRAARTTCSAARPPSQRRRQRRYTARHWRCGRRHAPTAVVATPMIGIAGGSGWARSCRPRRPSRPNCWLRVLRLALLLVAWTRVPMAQAAARALQQLLAAAVLEGRAPDAQAAWRPHNPWQFQPYRQQMVAGAAKAGTASDGARRRARDERGVERQGGVQHGNTARLYYKAVPVHVVLVYLHWVWETRRTSRRGPRLGSEVIGRALRPEHLWTEKKDGR